MTADSEATPAEFITRSVGGLDLTWIPDGLFVMGTDTPPEASAASFGGIGAYYEKECPAHTVTISGFWMGKYQVTNAEFARFVTSTGHVSQAERQGWGYITDEEGVWRKASGVSWNSPGWVTEPTQPVVLVSWYDAMAFVSWLASTTGEPFGLPTEAEWEYACRASSTTEFVWGDSPEDGCGWANVADMSARVRFPSWETFAWPDGYVYPSPVGSFRHNGWGLYDMVGNVWEWCDDWLGTYRSEPQHDPLGPSSGSLKVRRGGSWCYYPRACRSSFRHKYAPEARDNSLGFRVRVRAAPPTSAG